MFIFVSASAFDTNLEHPFQSEKKREKKSIGQCFFKVHAHLFDFLMIQQDTQKHIFALLIVLKGSWTKRPKKQSIISQVLHCLNFCQIRLSQSDSEKPVTDSETHKHSGFRLARRLVRSPVDSCGRFRSWVNSRSLSGLHAEQNLFHHRQLLESHIVLQSLIKKNL